MNTSEVITELAAALCKAQAAMKPAVKDATNPAFRSKYADLTSVWDACREPLTKNGISVLQDVTLAEKGVAVLTRLLHTSGQWLEVGPIVVPLTKNDAHGVGSATSYGRRYGLSAAIGIVSDDDDANAATGRTAEPAKPAVEVKAPAKVKAAPEGAFSLKTVEQHATSSQKPYWLIVTSAGEELVMWDQRGAAFAEQACQDGKPVRMQIKGDYQGKQVVQSMTLAEPPKANGKPTPELNANDIAF